jgi:hypothetical protein
MTKLRAFFIAAILSMAVTTNGFAFCFEEAGAEYGINPQILRAIAKVESNYNPAAVNMNTNGTYDFGLMQINSSWAATLGKKRWNKLGDACYNTKTGAWILAQCMNKYGYTWKAIGCYNSQTPTKRDRYAKRVFDQLQRVKPMEQEASYTPLKENVEDLLKAKVDGWVEQAAQKGKTRFEAKGKPYVPVPKEVLREPPSLTDSSLQDALPAIPASSLGPDPVDATGHNPSATLP